jgi:hypothetical protein
VHGATEDDRLTRRKYGNLIKQPLRLAQYDALEVIDVIGVLEPIDDQAFTCLVDELARNKASDQAPKQPTDMQLPYKCSKSHTANASLHFISKELKDSSMPSPIDSRRCLVASNSVIYGSFIIEC